MPSFDIFDQKFNMNWENIECLEIVYKILDALEDIGFTLDEGKDLSYILFPPFDPLKTFGKYC